MALGREAAAKHRHHPRIIHRAEHRLLVVLDAEPLVLLILAEAVEGRLARVVAQHARRRRGRRCARRRRRGHLAKVRRLAR